MGKFKNDSEDSGAMDIEEPQLKTKKNKPIIKKNKTLKIKPSLPGSVKSGKELITKFSKSVNLKAKNKSLEKKQ